MEGEFGGLHVWFDYNAHGTGLIARKEVRRPVAPVAGEEELLVYVQHHGRRKEGRKTGPLQ